MVGHQIEGGKQSGLAVTRPQTNNIVENAVGLISNNYSLLSASGIIVLIVTCNASGEPDHHVTEVRVLDSITTLTGDLIVLEASPERRCLLGLKC